MKNKKGCKTKREGKKIYDTVKKKGECRCGGKAIKKGKLASGQILLNDTQMKAGPFSVGNPMM